MAICSTATAWSRATPWSRPGRVASVTAATVPMATTGPSVCRPGLEQAGLGLQEGGRGVDLVTLGPESARPIGPAKPFGRVVQLGRRDQKRLGQSQVRRALGDGDPVLGRGEADPVELAVHLGQDVGPGEGGPTLGHALHRHAGRVSQDAIGQVAGVQERKVVALCQFGDPGDLVVSDVALRPPAPGLRHLGQAVVLLGRPGLQGGPTAQLEYLDTRWLAPMSERRTGRPALSCAPRWRPSAVRTRPSGPRRRRSLRSGAARNGAGIARPSPTPTASVNRSLSTPWCSSERATSDLNNPRESSVRQVAVGDRLRPVGHHHMVVELGIPGPRIPVGEGGGHDAFDVFLDHAVGARARVEHLALGVGEDHFDGAAGGRRRSVALVSRSASAHAVETDLDGEKVRSKPATGVRKAPPLTRSSASIRADSSARSATVWVAGMAAIR